MTEEEKIKIIVKALDSKRAENIKVIRVRDLTIIADYFIICDGRSTTQAKALADEVDYKMSQKGEEPRNFEKDDSNKWLILDYNDIVVHIFYKESRDFYDLDNLWADGEEVDIQKYLIKEDHEN